MNLLTRVCTRENREEAEGDNWDMTFRMVVGPKEMAAMSAEGVSRLRCHDAELERARAETKNQINKNAHLIRQLQGNSCVIKNKTRGEVGTIRTRGHSSSVKTTSE